MYYWSFFLATTCFAAGQNLGGVCWLVAGIVGLIGSCIADEEDDLEDLA